MSQSMSLLWLQISSACSLPEDNENIFSRLHTNVILLTTWTTEVYHQWLRSKDISYPLSQVFQNLHTNLPAKRWNRSPSNCETYCIVILWSYKFVMQLKMKIQINNTSFVKWMYVCIHLEYMRKYRKPKLSYITTRYIFYVLLLAGFYDIVR